jgi:asparagine synthase (glutamine-hydrolysing)
LSGLRRENGQRYLLWLAISDADWLSTSATADFRPHADGAARELERRAALPVSDPTRKAQLLDIALYLPGDLLVKVDIASMANSLEVRAPFLDRCLVEYALQLPTSLMIRGTRRKWVLRKAFAETLPPKNLARRKQGFGVPIGRWLRQELRPLLGDIVLSTSALERGYLRGDAVRAMVDEHLAGVDHSHRLWSLLMLELWHREFSIA